MGWCFLKSNAGGEMLYPETGAGGYTSVDGNVEFYGRINAILSRDMVVLDFGAGRGKDVVDDPVAYRQSLRNLRGKVRAVIGADVSSSIVTNPSLDGSVLIQPSCALPFASASIDLVVSDFTFEHVEDPVSVAKELDRVLRPGGWLCARTPNRWGYIALGASLIPNNLHVPALRLLQPSRQPIDVFPTAYRLNTPRSINRLFPPSRYTDYSYFYNAEPAYFGTSFFANAAARGLLRFLPMRWSALLMIFKQKKIDCLG